MSVIMYIKVNGQPSITDDYIYICTGARCIVFLYMNLLLHECTYIQFYFYNVFFYLKVDKRVIEYMRNGLYDLC